MEKIKLIKVQKSDAEFICKLMNDKSLLLALQERETPLGVWSYVISGWLKDDDDEDYILYFDGKPVGWLGISGLMSYTQRPLIKMLAILPEYQNLGVGTYAVHFAIENLRSRGYLSLDLHTDQSNIKAQKCYQKCGFEIIGSITQKMSNGTIVERYTMRCKL